MTKQNYLGIFIWIVALALLTKLGGGSIKLLINIPAFMGVGLGVAGALLLSNSSQQSRANRLKLASQAAWHSGIICFVVGMMCMLSFLNDPQSIGPNVAVALTSLLYGSIVSLVCDSLSQRPDKTAE
ncbi:MAG: hypothetical protein KKB51_08700 [Candidatus Riflebacteria bacterium]|nr:hypothetical protein [Candidatus Riflebacteria bacterium]